MIMKVLIFGAGERGRKLYDYLKNHEDKYQVIGFIDNKLTSLGGGVNIPVIKPEQCSNLDFDEVIISNMDLIHIEQMEKQCIDLGIEKSKIKVLSDNRELLINMLSLRKGILNEEINFRVSWLRDFANYVKMKKIKGNVAECGVYRGSFAHFINKYFSDRKCHLFDPFEGFRESDLKINVSVHDGFDNNKFNKVGAFAKTSPELVMSKMPFPDMCEIHQGYIPESTIGFKDEFCFVNLDMDLYKPMFEALKIFYPMMVKDGVLLLHDYFNKDLSQSIQKAVGDYENLIDRELCKIPIGDFLSIAIIKN